jgi:membrane protein implicated in regulation of membrane protease activity
MKESSSADLVDGTLAAATGVGILTVALCPLAIPIVALTMVALLPLLIIPLAAGLIALPVLLLRWLFRRTVAAVRAGTASPQSRERRQDSQPPRRAAHHAT